MEKTNSQTVQQSRISESEKELLRGIFANNEGLLLVLRNLFFGFELDEGEKKTIEKLKEENIKKLLRKIFLPELQKDIPIGQSIDLWMTIKLEDKESVEDIISGRKGLIQMLENALQSIEEGNSKTLDVDVKGKLDKPYFLARNTFISHIEMQLQIIQMIANSVRETSEELLARIKKDSSK